MFRLDHTTRETLSRIGLAAIIGATALGAVAAFAPASVSIGTATVVFNVALGLGALGAAMIVVAD